VRGTRLYGILTNNSNERLAGKSVGLLQRGMQVSFEADDGSSFYRTTTLIRWTQADEQGAFEFRVGPGEYELVGPAGGTQRQVTIADQADYEAHLPFEDVNRALLPLAGRATRSGDGLPG
jgi:hypothetical protein